MGCLQNEHDTSGGTYVVWPESILNQKDFAYEEILEYVKEEMNFKKSEDSFKMGFLN